VKTDNNEQFHFQNNMTLLAVIVQSLLSQTSDDDGHDEDMIIDGPNFWCMSLWQNLTWCSEYSACIIACTLTTQCKLLFFCRKVIESSNYCSGYRCRNSQAAGAAVLCQRSRSLL